MRKMLNAILFVMMFSVVKILILGRKKIEKINENTSVLYPRGNLLEVKLNYLVDISRRWKCGRFMLNAIRLCFDVLVCRRTLIIHFTTLISLL